MKTTSKERGMGAQNWQCDVRGCSYVAQKSMPLSPTGLQEDRDGPAKLFLCEAHHHEIVTQAGILASYESVWEFCLLHAGA